MIVSYFPGRIRLRFNELKNPVVGEQALARIQAVPGITRVELKPLTGSLLIEFDIKTLPPEKLFETGKRELAKFNITLELPNNP
ncbi:heavy metal translocating P-type ATPase [Treponema primitia ZAS-2]|uniref:Heavy metal translocating P-type ATPase n=1 Tax=Treponema primitia (strain ATCC BAA-887 / DSM 12427 / ZAS-2) TaxID=545694 RepID=F5YIT7_TREPZ|nr:hypothetical protein [Treponema primitia]AEF86469.1 heavy metal translocating P-type ATPase [Treponema primitia ZAS-2]